jgi:hypothetical protein
VVLKGSPLSPLFAIPIQQFALFADSGNGLRPIPFQIDPRNRKGRFIFPDGHTGITERNVPTGDDYRATPFLDELAPNDVALDELPVEELPLDDNDELVFMGHDLGRRSPNPYTSLAPYSGYGIESITELAITDTVSGTTRWAYIVTSQNANILRSIDDYVHYDADTDTVHSSIYQLGFSDSHPFLVERIQWKDPETGQWSTNYTDTMKVRHYGKLFGQFDFDRTQEDYASTLVAIKDGPVRVIRKTDNRVRILWFIRTPAIEIDFIAYANSFVVDTLIHMRFTISDFFSDAGTLFTMDWNEEIPPMHIFSPSFPEGATIDGKMQAADKRFSNSTDTSMVISNPFGKMLVTLDLEKDLPLTPYLYLMDDKNSKDAPENIPGQFGNAGFLTTGWENMDTQLHHIIFRVYMAQEVSVEQGFRILEHAPRSWPAQPDHK